MKILYCIPALHNSGGMERVLTEKVNFLANLPNYSIVIVTTDQQGKGICFELDKRVEIIHLELNFVEHFKYNLFKKYFVHKRKLHKYKNELFNLIKQHNVDICVSLCGKEIDFLYQLNSSCKKIAEIHFSMNHRRQFMTTHNNGFLWSFLGSIRTKQLIQSASKLDRLVVLTKDDLNQWKNSSVNVIQILNPNPLKNITQTDIKSKRVISIGRLDVQKGYDMLIEAWYFVNFKHPEWELSIYGEGVNRKDLEKLIIEKQLENKVFLHGQTTDVISKYNDSSFYVMSSRYEGLPMVLIEAMSCGLPIVSYDCECGPREIITDGVDGFLVKPNDIEGLAEKICILIENHTLRKSFSENAKLKANNFNLELIMPQWIELFNDLMKKSNFFSSL